MIKRVDDKFFKLFKSIENLNYLYLLNNFKSNDQYPLINFRNGFKNLSKSLKV